MAGQPWRCWRHWQGFQRRDPSPRRGGRRPPRSARSQLPRRPAASGASARRTDHYARMTDHEGGLFDPKRPCVGPCVGAAARDEIAGDAAEGSPRKGRVACQSCCPPGPEGGTGDALVGAATHDIRRVSTLPPAKRFGGNRKVVSLPRTPHSECSATGEGRPPARLEHSRDAGSGTRRCNPRFLSLLLAYSAGRHLNRLSEQHM